MSKHIRIFKVAYANDLEAYVPEWWVLEGLEVLNKTLVMAGMVNRNFEQAYANAGDVVHVPKVGTFTAKNKVDGSSLTIQDATGSDTEVRLNIHPHVSFELNETELREGGVDLFAEQIEPAIVALAERIDSAILGEAGMFFQNVAGEVAVDIDDAEMRELRKVMTANNNPPEDRNLTVGPEGESDLLGIARYTEADVTGFQEGLQINGHIGRAMGFAVQMSQNVSDARTIGTNVAEVEDSDGVVLKGNTAITLTAPASAHTAGSWCKIAGVRGVYMTVNAIAQTTGTAVVLFPALKGDMADNIDVTFYEGAGLVKGAHTQNDKVTLIDVITDGYAAAADVPVIGDYVSFGVLATADTLVYRIVDVQGTYASSSTEMTLSLNRPFDITIGNDNTVNVLPQDAGMNLAIRRNAITLVNRPLADVISGTGAVSQQVSGDGISLRITVSYNSDIQKYVVTVDTLLGVKILDVDQGALLLN